MVNIRSDHNKKPAWGLVEILVAMTIYGVAIIAITSLNARNYNVIRNNELTDRANKVMISATEFFKSPSEDVNRKYLTQQNFPSSGITRSFVLDTNSRDIRFDTNNPIKMNWISPNTNTIPNDCTESNPSRISFFLKQSNTPDNFLVCVRVNITRMSKGYKIDTQMVYKKGADWITNNLIGYRPFTYETNE